MDCFLDKLKKRINGHYLDKTLPPMVLLDGKWGSGKTHFIKNYYLDKNLNKNSLELPPKKQLFFSLYGINSLDDFKDKLLSYAFINRGDGRDILTHGKSLISSASSFIGSESSGLLSVIGGLAGAVKHSCLNDISNIELILDDLERLDDSKLQSQILGECLELAESKNFNVLVIANSESIDNKAILEKSFSEHIFFEYPKEYLFFHCIESIELSEDEEHFLKLNSQKFRNHRALKRGISQVLKIWSMIDNKELIHIRESFDTICKQVLAIAYAKYELNTDFEKIEKYASIDYMKLAVKKSLESDSRRGAKAEVVRGEPVEENSVLMDLFRYIRYETETIKLLYEGVTEFNDPIHQLALPEIDCKYWKLKRFDMKEVDDQSDLDLQVLELKKYLFKSNELSCYSWLIASDIYIWLINNNFINDNLNDALSELKLRVKAENFRKGGLAFINRHGYLENVLDKLKTELIEMAKLKDREQEHIEIKKYFSDDVYSATIALSSKGNTDIYFDLFDPDEIYKLIKNDWSHIDIIYFQEYLKDRYSQFIVNEFRKEAFFFDSLKGKLSSLKIKPDLKGGALMLLKNTLDEISQVLNNI